MPLTASEIAQRIARSKMDVPTIVARLRHWTTEGLLSHLGEGHHLQYDESVVEDAALLNETVGLGFDVGLLRRMLDQAGRAKYKWREKADKGRGLYLEIDTLPSGEKVFYLRDDHCFNKMADQILIFNLVQLFDRVNPDEEWDS